MSGETKCSIGGTRCFLTHNNYASNGALAVQATDVEDGFPHASLSVNINGYSDTLNKDCFFFDVNNLGFDALDELVEQGILELTPIKAKSGFVEYPLVKYLKL